MKQEEFNALMDNYKAENESTILVVAQNIYLVAIFVGVAFLIMERTL